MAVEIYTDSACSGNPGPGGWVILRYGDHEKEMNGGEIETTNNRMEMAVINRSLIEKSCDVDLYTDSVYVKDGVTKWLEGWKARDGALLPKTSQKSFVERIDSEINAIISAALDKGHAGHPENERADELARAGIPNWIK